MGVGQIIEAYQDLQNASLIKAVLLLNKVINVYSRSNKNPRMLPNASAGRRAAKATRSLMVTVVLI